MKKTQMKKPPMVNSSYFHQNILHRLETIISLSDDFPKHAYLLPEILSKTIRDLYRLTNDGLSHLGGGEIIELLAIPATEEEKTLLHTIEQSLRKITEYQELSQSYSRDCLLSLTIKIQDYAEKITIEEKSC